MWINQRDSKGMRNMEWNELVNQEWTKSQSIGRQPIYEQSSRSEDDITGI